MLSFFDLMTIFCHCAWLPEPGKGQSGSEAVLSRVSIQHEPRVSDSSTAELHDLSGGWLSSSNLHRGSVVAVVWRMCKRNCF